MWAFLVLFTLRLANAFSIRTFFQPDEFFQSLEPAHRFVFGYGYLTWEWREALRSAWHPLLYAVSYKTLLPVVSEPWAVYLGPKIVGAAVAAVGDAYTYKFALAYWRDASVARVALCMSVLSSWNWFVATRAFSNNLESALTVVALAHWPWHHFRMLLLLRACTFAFASCVVRPTNAILWAFLGVPLVVRNLGKWSRMRRLVVSVSMVLALVLALSALADRYFYGYWAFPLWRFVEFNVVRNLLIFYGAAPWHFYVLQGVPLMLMGYLPFFACALSHPSQLAAAVMFVVGVFSLIAHKEFRFLQPIYPVMLILSAREVAAFRAKVLPFTRYAALAAVVGLHVATAFLFTRVNEAGEIAVAQYIRDDPTVASVGFLTPCHSTPWQSMFHRRDLEDKSWFVTCEPPLHLEAGTRESMAAYRDELDRFFDNPAPFLAAKLPSDRPWPSHLVVFEPMENVVRDYLAGTAYRECRRFFNSYFHWDDRRRGEIIVFCNA